MSALANIVETGMAPVSSPPTLLTGKIKIATDLMQAFANDEGDKRRFGLVWDAVFNVQYSPKEFDEQLTNACSLASGLDTSNGWKAPEGAKGQQKYGPKRQSMNARCSELRQLFGALLFTKAAKTVADDGAACAPTLSKQEGYATAVKKARKALSDEGLTWEGQPAKTEAQKAVEKERNLIAGVSADWMKKHPQNAGESLREYTTRMVESVQILVEEEKGKAAEAEIKAVVDALEKKHGLAFCSDVAMMLIERYNESIEAEGEETLREEAAVHEEA